MQVNRNLVFESLNQILRNLIDENENVNWDLEALYSVSSSIFVLNEMHCKSDSLDFNIEDHGDLTEYIFKKFGWSTKNLTDHALYILYNACIEIQLEDTMKYFNQSITNDENLKIWISQNNKVKGYIKKIDVLNSNYQISFYDDQIVKYLSLIIFEYLSYYLKNRLGANKIKGEKNLKKNIFKLLQNQADIYNSYFDSIIISTNDALSAYLTECNSAKRKECMKLMYDFFLYYLFIDEKNIIMQVDNKYYILNFSADSYLDGYSVKPSSQFFHTYNIFKRLQDIDNFIKGGDQ